MSTPTRSARVDLTTRLLGYLAIADPAEPADIIWALGSHDDRVALAATDLYHRGLAPWIVFSGGRGHRWTGLSEPEADLFAATAMGLGVPVDRIVIENQSSNTAENITRSLAILDERRIAVDSALLITIPPFQRRASLTVHTHRPSIRCINCPPSWGLPSEWTDEALALGGSLCVGEIQRLREYPGRGFLDWDPSNLPQELIDTAADLERRLAETRTV